MTGLKLKTVTAEELTKAYQTLFPQEVKTESDFKETERILGNWLKGYAECPEQKLATTNWCGKVTKALFLALNIKMPRTKKEMLVVLQSHEMDAASQAKLRDVKTHLDEIQNLFLDRMSEQNLSERLKDVKTVPEAFTLLEDNSLSEEERNDLVSSLRMALSDATENFLFEYLLQRGYYKSEEDFCQECSSDSGLIEGEGEPYLDMRLKSEFTIYVQLHSRLFTDENEATAYYNDLTQQFEDRCKEKVFLRVCQLRDDLQTDIEGLEIQWEQAESTDQLDNLRKERLESQLYVTRNILKRVKGIVNDYFGIKDEEQKVIQPAPVQNFSEEKTVVVSFTRTVTMDVPAGADEEIIKVLAAEEYNSLDPEDRNMGPQHASILEYLSVPAASKPLRLSSFYEKDRQQSEVEAIFYSHPRQEFMALRSTGWVPCKMLVS
ncbi:hypothetical protein PUW24_06130 [Paenibacillus urinalis]|uniref:DUF3375 domain-containing protein n=1 Tax=Paenibacillus urinalis TaxID=521520 RepID=A0AAX3N035_9BACL|nr:hypothetical protein [Paenibacillus urinalis]WDH82444.1 hypothetical protein PUW23_23860 [Paenibacillus urinalis]WDH98501.1 hypothetical protein PUW24_06130 [Paenibacillus urinalis]WDI02192.1 hypothetical protein PUW25_23855 [Paenibacillus urinalis]